MKIILAQRGSGFNYQQYLLIISSGLSYLTGPLLYCALAKTGKMYCN